MLYSLNFVRRLNQHERRMFYAENDTEAIEYIRTFLDAMGLYEEEVWLERHPRGFIFQREKLGPLYWPPEKREKAGGASKCENGG